MKHSLTPKLRHLLVFYLCVLCITSNYTVAVGLAQNVRATDHPHITIEELCEIFSIPPSNCSCSVFQIKDPLIKSLCDIDEPVVVSHSSNLQKTYGSLAIFFSVVGAVGNTLVVFVSASTTDRLTTCQKLVTALAACDLVSAVFQFIKSLRNLWTNRWIYGLLLCKLFNGIEQLGTCLSMGMILIVCIERYVGILHPFDRGMSPRRLKMALLTNITAGICAVIPCFIYFSDKHLSTCVIPNRMFGRVYYICIALIFYIIPLCVIFVLYINIAKHLSVNSKATSNSGLDPFVSHERAMNIRRAIIKMAAIVVAFMVCVLPRHAVHIFFEFIRAEDVGNEVYNKYVVYQYLAYLPYPLHVAINPIIYSVVDPTWRREVRQVVHNLLFKWKMCCSRESGQHSGSKHGGWMKNSKQDQRIFSFTNEAFSDKGSVNSGFTVL